MKKDLAAYHKAFIHQHDQTDCGVACLASLVRFYGGDARLDRLRELSGTGRQGTTMLGLHEGAKQSGLNADAYEARISDLKENKIPAILHVLIDKTLQHYVICYGYKNNAFVISDPARGIKLYTEQELEDIWQSKALLLVEPNENFVKAEAVKSEKMSWLKKLVEPDMNILGMSLFLGVGIAVLGMATAVFSQKLIDDILPNRLELKLTVGLSLLFFLLMVRAGITYIRQYFLLNQSRSFNNRITRYFYSTLLRLPKSFFDSRKTGELIARMNDTGRIQSALSYLGATLMIDVLLVITSTIFLLAYSPALGLTGLACIPLFFAITYMHHARILSSQKDVMQAYARNEGNYVDTMQGIRVIKSTNRENDFAQSTMNIYDAYQQKVYDLGKVRISFNLVADITSTVLVAGIITWGSMMVLDDTLKLGAFMAVIQMTGMLMPAAGRLALTNIQLQEARVAFERMFEFTSVKPEYDEEADKQKHGVKDFESLTVSGLSFRFPGRQQILRNVSFSIRKGEVIAILGESGSGKSTLLQVLERFYKYEDGAVLLNGLPFENISTAGWRSLISSVPQDTKLFSGTLIDNICLGNAAEEAERVITFCIENGFDKYFSQFPQGYLTILGEDGVNISGGQQQLVALARALYKKPKLLLLDEPTSAMDRNTEGFIMDLLTRQREHMSLILVTHRIKTARQADCIYILENGVIKESGKHEQLIANENLYSLSYND